MPRSKSMTLSETVAAKLKSDKANFKTEGNITTDYPPSDSIIEPYSFRTSEAQIVRGIVHSLDVVGNNIGKEIAAEWQSTVIATDNAIHDLRETKKSFWKTKWEP